MEKKMELEKKSWQLHVTRYITADFAHPELESWQLHITRYITADFAHYACWRTDKPIAFALRIFWETPMYWDDAMEQQLYFDWCHEQGIEFDDHRARDCVTMLLEYIECSGWSDHYHMMMTIRELPYAWDKFADWASIKYGDDFTRECSKSFFTAFNSSYGAHYRKEMLENVGGDWKHE